MKIYLAGSIPKGDEEIKSFQDWRAHYMEVVKRFLDAEFIIPRAGEVDETDHLLVVGKDSSSIKNSDLVILYAENRLGVGSATELVIAKYLNKPVIVVLPKNTHHRKSNVKFGGVLVEDWVHPFIGVFADFVLDKIEDIETIKDQIFSDPPKNISVIDRAIQRYAER